MYIFGGYLGTQNMHLGDLYEFDTTSSHWRRIHPHGTGPSPRRRQCSVVVGDRVYIFGGTMSVFFRAVLKRFGSPYVFIGIL